jgi:GT2 family glycosyltransferase
MTKVDVVMLSLAVDKEVYNMNVQAISSLLEGNPSVEFQIILLESNPDFANYGWEYAPQVTVAYPKSPFNFNAFNNIGLQHGNSDWVMFCNNDLVFHPGSVEAMLKIAGTHPQISCFCPVDSDSPHTPPGFFPAGCEYVEGYHVRTTFTGWCFLVKRSTFQVTGPFDEQFDYYFADDDFTMVMRMHDIRSAAVPSAYVRHLAHITSQKASLDISGKFKEAQRVFHLKWGSQRSIAWKNRLVSYFLRPFGMTGLIRQLYGPKPSWKHSGPYTETSKEPRGISR